jgi:hypothetical protein
MELRGTGEVTEPGGTQPPGRLVLAPEAEGRMVTVTTAGDPLPPATDAEAAALLGNMVKSVLY